MLAKLRMTTKADSEEFGYYQSSNLQAVLMDQIDTEYAEILHEHGLNPYTQYLIGKETKEWVVTTTTKEAYEKIIECMMNPKFDKFEIKKKSINVDILDKQVVVINKRDLTEEFYEKKADRFIKIELLTPTAFRSAGKYVNYPTLRLFYQSLMNKYSASADNIEMFDEETLEQLIKESEIVSYKLHSTAFPLEGVRIPSFKGSFTIKVTGSETMARYVRLLARFGEFSGLGIKASMGMGAMIYKEEAK